ncbi:MAG: hypothetical protein V1927_06165 [Candidatus Omnitrophota bacterium]
MKRLIFLIFGISFLYALPAYNKFWFPFDEGIALVAVDILKHGGIPYQDFVTPFGVIQHYLLSAIFYVFGTRIEVAHLYILTMHAAIATAIFYLTYLVSGNKKISLGIWIVSLSCLAPRMGVAVTSIWPFMFFSILSMLFYVWFLGSRNKRDLIIAGLFTGATILSRFELGFYLLAGEALILLLHNLMSKKLGGRNSINTTAAFFLYAVSAAILPLILLTYLWKVGVIGSFIYSVLLPYTGIVKYGHMSFPPPCLDPRQIFYGSLFFIQVNQHYIPILTYIAALLSCIYLTVKRLINVDRLLTILFISVFGSLIFTLAIFGADATHTMPVIYPALILTGFLFTEMRRSKNSKDRLYAIAMRIFFFLIAFLLMLLFIKNTDKYFKNTVVKPFTKKICLMKTPRGNIYVPEDEFDDVNRLIGYLAKNTAPGEKIFIGFDDYKEVLHGGPILIYFLADRLPSTKHFVAFPGTTNREAIQKDIIASLHDIRLIVLMGYGKILVNAPEAEHSCILDDYIRSHYRPVTALGRYDVYIRNI